MKKLLTLLFTLTVFATMMSVFPLPASAATSGTTGDYCVWALDGTELTISGKGAMGNYSPRSSTPNAPWYGATVTKVTIKSGVTHIGDYAFCGCTNLVSVTISDSVTHIGDYAFSGCKSLVNITLPNSVTCIGECAFNVCASLESITIPGNVKEIENFAFGQCSGLKSITIPGSVTGIDEKAFWRCANLENIVLPDGFTSISADMLVDTAFYNNEANWENGVLYIGSCLLQAKPNNLPYTYKVKEGTVGIATNAFSGCTNLVSVTLPNSVTCIGEGAFSLCESLKSITLLCGVTKVGYGVFSGCTSLTNISISDIAAWCMSDFGCSLTGAKNLYVNGELVTDLVVPDGVTRISDYAFSSCKSLVNITLPNSVTCIGEGAFSLCESFANITIPENVTSIGEGAFFGCKSLVSIKLPYSVTRIGECAFYGRGGLTEVSTDVYYAGNKEDWNKIILEEGNESLTLATFHFESAPSTPTSTNPTATQPTAIQPSATNPTATQPSATNPTATEPSSQKAVISTYINEDGDMVLVYSDGTIEIRPMPTQSKPSTTATEPAVTGSKPSAIETDPSQSAEATLGDANGDNAVNMKDVLALRKHLADMPVSINLDASDVNADDTVNMKDVLMLRKYLADMIDKLGA